jgi:hypothetical protein
MLDYDFLDTTQDRSEFELITIKTLCESLDSTLHFIAYVTPVSTDMKDWKKLKKSLKRVLRHYLAKHEYDAMMEGFKND